MVSSRGSLSFAPAAWNKYMGKNKVANMALVGRKYNASNVSKLTKSTNSIVNKSKALNKSAMNAVKTIVKNKNNATKHYNTAMSQMKKANKEAMKGNIANAKKLNSAAKNNLIKAKKEITTANNLKKNFKSRLNNMKKQLMNHKKNLKKEMNNLKINNKNNNLRAN